MSADLSTEPAERRAIFHPTQVVLTLEHLQRVVEHFMKYDAFAFDVESMGEHRGVPTQNNVVWLSMATHGMSVSIPFGHPNGDVMLTKATRRKNKATGKFDPIPATFSKPPKQLLPGQVFRALEPLFFSDRIKIAHNATFDVISIAKYYGGRVIPGPIHDTIVMQWLLDENITSKGLKDLIKKYYAVVYDHENVGKCIEAHTFSKVAHYAYMDAKYTFFLWKNLLPHIDAQALSEVFDDYEVPITTVESHMGLAGATVDVDRLEELRVELSDRLVEISGRIYQIAGRKFNINAAGQKSEMLFAPKSEGGQGLKPKFLTKGGQDKDKKGQPLGYSDYSTKAEHLETYAGNTLVDALLEYADVNKVLSTYVLGYLGDPDDPKKPCIIFDGKVHADLVQYGTVTGRFSCRAPNLQNIPRPGTDLGTKVRGLFIAPPGHKLIVADYGQIEMVLTAHFAGPGPLFNGIKFEGMDPHSATAAALGGFDPIEFMQMVTDEDATAKALRQAAKAINFAIVYGAGPDKVAAMAGITLKEAKRFLEIHQEQFPEIYRFKKRVLANARGRKPAHVRTISGRKRRVPALMARDNGPRGRAERQIVNSLVQGSAADVIKKAMIRLHERLEPEMLLILSVHDELVVQAPDHLADRAAEIMRDAMLGDGIQAMSNVPIKSDLKICDRWSEAK